MRLLEVVKAVLKRAQRASSVRHMRSDNLRSLRRGLRVVSSTARPKRSEARNRNSNASYVITDVWCGRPVYINGERCMIRA